MTPQELRNAQTLINACCAEWAARCKAEKEAHLLTLEISQGRKDEIERLRKLNEENISVLKAEIEQLQEWNRLRAHDIITLGAEIARLLALLRSVEDEFTYESVSGATLDAIRAALEQRAEWLCCLDCGALVKDCVCEQKAPDESTKMITWMERLEDLWNVLGRRPTLDELLEAAKAHKMTPAEIDAQRQSWVRGMTARCEHGEVDFEQCPKCRERRL